MEGWPGWVDLGGWLYTEIDFPIPGVKPQTNWERHGVNLLIETNALPLRETTNQQTDRQISLSVCLCLSVRGEYLWNRWTDLHKCFCADSLWPWLGPLLAALQYVMYFRFFGWRQGWPYSNVWLAAFRYRAESDIYECRVVIMWTANGLSVKMNTIMIEPSDDNLLSWLNRC